MLDVCTYEVVCSDNLWSERHAWFVLELPPNLLSKVEAACSGQNSDLQEQHPAATPIAEIKCAFDAGSDSCNGCGTELVCCTEDSTYKLSTVKQDVTMYFTLSNENATSATVQNLSLQSSDVVMSDASEQHGISANCSDENITTDSNVKTVLPINASAHGNSSAIALMHIIGESRKICHMRLVPCRVNQLMHRLSSPIAAEPAALTAEDATNPWLVTPRGCLTLSQILLRVQGSRKELEMQLLSDCHCIANVASSHELDGNASPRHSAAQSGMGVEGEVYWCRISSSDVLAVLRLFLAQMTIGLENTQEFALQTAVDTLVTSAEQEGFQIAAQLPLTIATVLQLICIFSELKSVCSICGGRGCDTGDACMSTTGNKLICASVREFIKSRDYTAFTHKLAGDTEWLSKAAHIKMFTVDTLKVLCAMQAAVMSQRQQMSYEQLVSTAAALMEEVLPVDLPGPAVQLQRLNAALKADGAATAQLYSNSLLKDNLRVDRRSGDLQFDAYYGFPLIQLVDRPVSAKGRSRYAAGMVDEQRGAAEGCAVLLAGNAYVTVHNMGYGVAANADAPRLDIGKESTVHAATAQSIKVHYMPHHTLPWEVHARCKRLLEIKEDWFEEELRGYLSHAAGRDEDAQSQIDNAITKHCIRVSKHAPHVMRSRVMMSGLHL